MNRASRIESAGSWTVSGTAGRGREKGVWGVERACHTGQHRSLQSVCVTQEIGADLGSRVLSRCERRVCEGSIPPSSTAKKWPSTRTFVNVTSATDSPLRTSRMLTRGFAKETQGGAPPRPSRNNQVNAREHPAWACKGRNRIATSSAGGSRSAVRQLWRICRLTPPDPQFRFPSRAAYVRPGVGADGGLWI